MKCAVNSKVNKWLFSQPWIGQFTDNLRNGNLDPEDKLSLLLGGKGKGTIDYAFCWEDSPEGTKFWSDKDSEFVELWKENEWGKSTVYIEI